MILITQWKILELYGIEELPECTFTLSFKTIDHHQKNLNAQNIKSFIFAEA